MGDDPPGPAPRLWATPHLGKTPAPWAGMLVWLSYLRPLKHSTSSSMEMSDCFSHFRAGSFLPGRERTREPLEREENHMLFLKSILSEC